MKGRMNYRLDYISISKYLFVFISTVNGITYIFVHFTHNFVKIYKKIPNFLVSFSFNLYV